MLLEFTLVLPSLLPVLRLGLKALPRPRMARNSLGMSQVRPCHECRGCAHRKGQDQPCCTSLSAWGPADPALYRGHSPPPHPDPPRGDRAPPAAILPGSARTPAQPRGAAPGLSAV